MAGEGGYPVKNSLNEQRCWIRGKRVRSSGIPTWRIIDSKPVFMGGESSGEAIECGC
jgi:hypothetical protein